MLLYRITNSVNCKAYIGIVSKSARKRFVRHIQNARHYDEPNSALHRAIRKYGAHCFSVEQIGAAVDWASLKEMERAAISLYATMAPSGYNLTLGGDGQLGVKLAPAHHKKMLAARKFSAESRARMGAWRRGKKQSAETVGKRAAAMREIWKNPGQRAKRIAALVGHKGCVHSDEMKQKLRRERTGTTRSAEDRRKISAGMMGHKVSPATRRKLSEKAKARGVPRSHIEHMVRCRLAKMKTAEA